MLWAENQRFNTEATEAQRNSKEPALRGLS
jgi:hypothetical protein